MKNAIKAREAKKPVLVYENASFLIYTIPLNFEIRYELKRKNVRPGLTQRTAESLVIDHYHYSPLDRGLEYAKETANYMLEKMEKQYARNMD